MINEHKFDFINRPILLRSTCYSKLKCWEGCTSELLHMKKSIDQQTVSGILYLLVYTRYRNGVHHVRYHRPQSVRQTTAACPTARRHRRVSSRQPDLAFSEMQQTQLPLRQARCQRPRSVMVPHSRRQGPCGVPKHRERSTGHHPRTGRALSSVPGAGRRVHRSQRTAVPCPAQAGPRGPKGGAEQSLGGQLSAEIATEVEVLLGERLIDEDFQANENAVRDTALRIGARIVERRLNADRSDHQGAALPCRCGDRARNAGRRPKTVTTALVR